MPKQLFFNFLKKEKIMANDGEWITGKVTLNFKGIPVDMEMTVPAKPVKARRMLPVFQTMTSSFVNLSVQAAEEAGREISCKKGCGACCRQAVPLAEVEIYQIAELVETLPEPRRTEIKQKFEEGCRRFRENGWFERLDDFARLSMEERGQIIKDYFYEGVACPFLEDESCSIHAERPLSCREYLVTTPAENCARPSNETVRMVEMPIKPSRTLRYVGLSGNSMKINFIPMIRALEWAENYPERAQEKAGQEWMADFFRTLTENEIPAK
jgi:Fe-S-cluster containining protein